VAAAFIAAALVLVVRRGKRNNEEL